MKKVFLITDGACLGNPGPGGWGAILRFKDKEKILYGSNPKTTNNRMELLAVINGLEALQEKCDVLISSDSKYIINAIKEGWLTRWIQNDWKTAAKKPVKNKDLWLKLSQLLAFHNVTWEWVKGHNGNIDNEKVDAIAREAAKTLKNM